MFFVTLLLLFILYVNPAKKYKTVKDLLVASPRLMLTGSNVANWDVYYPVDKKALSRLSELVHGGGLQGGGKHIPEERINRGFAAVAVNGFFSPKAKNPAYCLDCGCRGMDIQPYSSRMAEGNKIFVSGNIPGGFQTLNSVMDKK